MAYDPLNSVFYVTGVSNNQVVKLSSNGSWLAVWTNDTSNSTNTFNTPAGVATDSSGNVIVVDSGNNRVVKMTSSGSWIWTVSGNTTYQLNYP